MSVTDTTSTPTIIIRIGVLNFTVAADTFILRFLRKEEWVSITEKFLD